MSTSSPSKLKLDLPLILPDIRDAADQCVTRLIASLNQQTGISDAHLIVSESKTPQLCIHYDPALVSMRRVRERVLASGAQLTSQFAHLSVRTAAPLHARAASHLGDRLRALPGVIEAEASVSGAIRIEYDRSANSEAAINALLAEAGVPLPGDQAAEPDASRDAHEAPASTDDARHDDHGHETKGDHAGHHHADGGLFGEKSELIFALIAGALSLGGWLSARNATGPVWWSTAAFIAAYFFGGFYTAREALDNLRSRRFEIDTLMLVAAIGAAALGKWGEGALLLFLFSLGHSLEHFAMGRARRAIEALAKLAPETATVRRGDRTEEVAVAQLQVGDVILVRPNERLPADGVVIAGTSSVNQAPVTGESVPVDKQAVQDLAAALANFDKVPPQHRVFAGTINGSGALEVSVARRSDQSTMARVVKMVTEAEAQRSPTQQLTERFERIFVPSILALIALLLFAWVVVDEPFATSFYRAMAVLVAASPCALAISVPSAVLSGIARAAHGGVLVKGGGPLENLGTLTSIAFDKTGTLTEGKPKLTDVVAADACTVEELLNVALAVEKHSDHPLASAVVSGAIERLAGKAEALSASDLRSITGRGVQAQVGADLVFIGKPVLFSEMSDLPVPPDVTAANQALVDTGRTTMIVRRGKRYLGVIGVMDTPRPVAAQVMRELRALGIQRLIMISGDNQRVADAIARSVGLTEAQGDLMPEQKVEAIKLLRQNEGKVAMVGDGVNDAPALANATVGIAMGAAGSDVALETADVALMSDDLAQLPFAVGLSRATSRIIKQNLWVSIGVVVVLIPSTILGLSIGTAVLFHEGSTILVVINALRLLAYRAARGSSGTSAPPS